MKPFKIDNHSFYTVIRDGWVPITIGDWRTIFFMGEYFQYIYPQENAKRN